MKATLDKFQVLLLRRLYDACLLDASATPDFKELMEAEISKLSENWFHEAYEDFVALDLLDSRASGEDFGPTPFGRLSSYGRWFVENLDARGVLILPTETKTQWCPSVRPCIASSHSARSVTSVVSSRRYGAGARS